MLSKRDDPFKRFSVETSFRFCVGSFLSSSVARVIYGGGVQSCALLVGEVIGPHIFVLISGT